MIRQLNKNCEIIWIPNTYFDGYFPQCKIKKFRINKDSLKKFPDEDGFLNEIMETSPINPNIEDILDRICDPNFIDRKFIQDVANESFIELERRESECDIKISDYLKLNVFGKQVFFSQNHPCPTILIETTRRILRLIGINGDNFLNIQDVIRLGTRYVGENNFECRGRDLPIYPSVAKFFDIQEDLYGYIPNMRDNYSNFRDFQREYIKCCWAEKFTR